jgi:hypothetical protein
MKYSLPLKENHKALWNWLADNPAKGKQDWPGLKTISKMKLKLPHYMHFLTFSCFACQATPLIGGACFDCHNCPVDWKADKCTSDGSLYKKWMYAKNAKDCSKYARLIARGWKP